MGKKITKLTADQEARFPEFVRKWIDIGLSTAPADRPRAEAAIAGLYRLAKLKEPRVIWLPCPMSAMISAACYAAIIQHRLLDEKPKKNDAVDDAVNGAVNGAVRQAVGAAVGGAARAYFGGSIWNAGYSAWADYFNEVCGIAIDRNFLDMTENCGFYWTLDGICFASERPAEIHLDQEGRLHCETGMSIRYAGTGWGLFHWHGTKVPADWIIDRDNLKPAHVLKTENLEQRRAGCEMLGWSRILAGLNARTIDRDGDPEIGELVEVNLPDLAQPAKFLRVRCGTGREFAIGIPPHITKALDAQAWCIGLEPNQFMRPEIRT